MKGNRRIEKKMKSPHGIAWLSAFAAMVKWILIFALVIWMFQDLMKLKLNMKTNAVKERPYLYPDENVLQIVYENDQSTIFRGLMTVLSLATRVVTHGALGSAGVGAAAPVQENLGQLQRNRNTSYGQIVLNSFKLFDIVVVMYILKEFVSYIQENVSPDALVGFALGVGATLGVMGLCAIYFACKHRDQINGQTTQNKPIEAQCKCDENESKCERHDEKLLSKISKIVSSSGDMMDFGLGLDIKRKVIESCFQDNKDSINTATLKMLQKWYDRQLAFKANSDAIIKLKNVLKDTGLEVQGTKIIDEHFANR